MNIWIIGLATLIPLFAMAVLMVTGKDSWLIAGYNTSSPEKQAEIDAIALGRFIGYLLFFEILCLLLVFYGIDAHKAILYVIGGILSLVSTLAAAVYINTGNHFRKKP